MTRAQLLFHLSSQACAMSTPKPEHSLLKHVSQSMRRSLIWAVLPMVCLLAHYFFGEIALVALALGLPVVWLLMNSLRPKDSALRQAAPDVIEQTQIETHINDVLFEAKPSERLAVFCLKIDGAETLQEQLGSADLLHIQHRLYMRYASRLRSNDIVYQTGPLHWTIVVMPGVNLDIEAAIQQSKRLQEVTDEPMMLRDDRLYLTSCIGFTTTQKPCKGAHVALQEAQTALAQATMNGPDSIRAFSKSMTIQKRQESPVSLPDLNGEIDSSLTAWFQPQISTDTGQITGFEALARWTDRGGQLYPPATVLPVLLKSGLMDRLTDIILAQSLNALSKWDALGLDIKSVGVNFSDSDLTNPSLYEKVAWDLDRFQIEPNRLCIEILESVIAGDADDIVVRNVKQLAELGCQIDLDDFGTGHASISTLRRLPVNRLKIDRSFVSKADIDPEQQKMVATILMMADRLDLCCLAEGVETLGEQSILSQLGCRYVQGFGIAKPMPFEATLTWIAAYQAKQYHTPEIGRKIV